MLRAGGLKVEKSILVIKSYIKFLNETIKTFDDVLPLTQDKRIFDELKQSIMPYRYTNKNMRYITIQLRQYLKG
jgi:hypothetical protein